MPSCAPENEINLYVGQLKNSRLYLINLAELSPASCLAWNTRNFNYELEIITKRSTIIITHSESSRGLATGKTAFSFESGLMVLPWLRAFFLI